MLAGCGGPTPPARWAEGGARVDLPSARGVLNEESVAIEPKGTWAVVLVDDEVVLHVDAAGRVYDRRKRPLGMLESDGRVAGQDDALLGIVGSAHASPPWQASAWVSVLPDGRVVGYDDRGGAEELGGWNGCAVSATASQVCVLVTHMLLLGEERARQRRGGGPQLTPGVGFVIVR
jgi:hypothetical protein